MRAKTKNTPLTALLLAASSAFPTASAAVAWGSGGYGEGCCGIPPGLEERAQQLEQSFAETSNDALAQQRWAGTLCENHPCAGEVTEAQAKDLLENWAAREQRRTDVEMAEKQRWWDGLQKIMLGVIAFGGLFLGFLNRYRPRS